MSRSAVFPSKEEGLALHARLQAGDRLAFAVLCDAYLDPMLAWLAHHCPCADPHLRTSAAHSVLVSYLQSPDIYQPQRGGLGMFLCMAARCDLDNLRRQEQRHHRRRISWSDVEMGENGGNFYERDNDPVCLLERDEERTVQRERLNDLRETLSQLDRAVLDLMREGKRGTAPFVPALGLEGRPLDEQIREVKRAKDRVMKRLERGGTSHE